MTLRINGSAISGTNNNRLEEAIGKREEELWRREGYKVTFRSKSKCDPGINQLICLYKNYTYLHKLNSFLCSFVGLLDANRTTVCGKNYLTLLFQSC